MTDDILKKIDQCILMTSGYSCECAGNMARKHKQHFVECPNYSQPAWQALRFAVERLGQIKKHWGVICGESRPNSLKSPMTVILKDAEKEISEILGVSK